MHKEIMITTIQVIDKINKSCTKHVRCIDSIIHSPMTMMFSHCYNYQGYSKMFNEFYISYVTNE